MNPQISFIIPAWNEEKAIGFTLEGLAGDASGYSHEIIIVDDASHKKLADEIRPEAAVHILRNPERRGLAKTLNEGAKRAAGEILIFLDAHVCFSKNWIAKLLSYKDLLKNTVIGTAIQPIYGLKEFRKQISGRGNKDFRPGEIYYGHRLIGFPEPAIHYNFDRLNTEIFQVPYIASCAFAITKDLFFKLGSFEHELTGFGSILDLEFCMRAWALGCEVAVIPSIVCYHCYYKENPKEKIKADPQAHPFQSEKYAHSLENAVRVFYLQSSEELFGSFLRHHESHPGFKVDLKTLINEPLKGRRRMIEQKRKRSSDWVFDRMAYAGVGKPDHEISL